MKRLTCLAFGVLLAWVLASCGTPTSVPSTAAPTPVPPTATRPDTTVAVDVEAIASNEAAEADVELLGEADRIARRRGHGGHDRYPGTRQLGDQSGRHARRQDRDRLVPRDPAVEGDADLRGQRIDGG